MAELYAYNFAYIDRTSRMCVQVFTTTNYADSESNLYDVVELDVLDGEYLFKYYIDGNWYVDAEGTIPWQSELN